MIQFLVQAGGSFVQAGGSFPRYLNSTLVLSTVPGSGVLHTPHVAVKGKTPPCKEKHLHVAVKRGVFHVAVKRKTPPCSLLKEKHLHVAIKRQDKTPRAVVKRKTPPCGS